MGDHDGSLEDSSHEKAEMESRESITPMERGDDGQSTSVPLVLFCSVYMPGYAHAIHTENTQT